MLRGFFFLLCSVHINFQIFQLEVDTMAIFDMFHSAPQDEMNILRPSQRHKTKDLKTQSIQILEPFIHNIKDNDSIYMGCFFLNFKI